MSWGLRRDWQQGTAHAFGNSLQRITSERDTFVPLDGCRMIYDRGSGVLDVKLDALIYKLKAKPTLAE